jgi:hypothetical protein
VLFDAVLENKALKPTAVLPFAVTLHLKALAPKAVLYPPVVTPLKVLYPTATFWTALVDRRRAFTPIAVLATPVVLLHKAFVPTLVLLDMFPPPSPISTPFTVISLLVVKAEPVIETEPVKVCVLVRAFPKILEPLEYTTDELTVLTTSVCAVNVDDTVKDPVIDWSALKLFDPVVA